MKLIIDIPKQMYLNAKADTLCGADILVSAIKDGTPHETVTEFADRCRECGRGKVLDKIRAEIENMKIVYDKSANYKDERTDEEKANSWGKMYKVLVLSIIDKHKAESEEKE